MAASRKDIITPAATSSLKPNLPVANTAKSSRTTKRGANAVLYADPTHRRGPCGGHECADQQEGRSQADGRGQGLAPPALSDLGQLGAG
ncbi:MAG: hypothetical protein QXK62_02130 [Thermoproteus sp.]